MKTLKLKEIFNENTKIEWFHGRGKINIYKNDSAVWLLLIIVSTVSGKTTVLLKFVDQWSVQIYNVFGKSLEEDSYSEIIHERLKISNEIFV